VEAVTGIRDGGKPKSLRNTNSLQSAPIRNGLYGMDCGRSFKCIFGGRRIARDHLGIEYVWIITHRPTDWVHHAPQEQQLSDESIVVASWLALEGVSVEGGINRKIVVSTGKPGYFAIAVSHEQDRRIHGDDFVGVCC
jgi:hypothetical protein